MSLTCAESGGGTNETGMLFRKACKSLSPNRPTVANGNPNGGGIDIQGHSHSGNKTFISFHGDNPFVPQILSECCSCTSQRLPAEARMLPACIAKQNSPGLLPFVLGSTGVRSEGTRARRAVAARPSSRTVSVRLEPY